MIYQYFYSYQFAGKDGLSVAFGNGHVNMPKMIDDFEDIQKLKAFVEGDLSKANSLEGSVTILTFQLLKEIGP